MRAGPQSISVQKPGGTVLNDLAKSLQLSDSATLWTVACQAPPSMRFSRQEYWSGLPLPSPNDTDVSLLVLVLVLIEKRH